jgi:hypothetical protein
MVIAVVPVTSTSMPYPSRTGAAALRIDETRLFVASVAGPLFGVTERIEMSPVSFALAIVLDGLASQARC